MTYVAHERAVLRDDSFGEPLTITKSCQDPDTFIVVATGWCGGRLTARYAARQLIATASQDKSKVAIVTYDDPQTGNGAYSQSYRTERFAHVLRLYGRAKPAIALGHSRGWLSVAESGGDLVQSQFLGAAIGLTPVGLAPLTSVRHEMHGLLHEARHAASAVASLGGLATTAFLGYNILRHSLFHPIKTFAEVQHIFQADATRQTVALSQAIPMTLVLAQNDELFSNHIDRDKLACAGYQGGFADIATTHLGALTNNNQAPSLYRHIAQIAGLRSDGQDTPESRIALDGLGVET